MNTSFESTAARPSFSIRRALQAEGSRSAKSSVIPFNGLAGSRGEVRASSRFLRAFCAFEGNRRNLRGIRSGRWFRDAKRSQQFTSSHGRQVFPFKSRRAEPHERRNWKDVKVDCSRAGRPSPRQTHSVQQLSRLLDTKVLAPQIPLES